MNSWNIYTVTKSCLDKVEIELVVNGRAISLKLVTRLNLDHYISFCDNAVGIERDALETVFNPFYTTKENGTGLGLYILQSEVGKTGGSISAESYPKKGTTFNITLSIERG